MDSTTERILVQLSFFIVIKYGILELQKLAIFQQNAQMMITAVFIGQRRRVNAQRKCWQFPRYGGFLEQPLMGSFSDGDF